MPNRAYARAPRLALAVQAACRLDVEALKPGNVSLRAAGHDMTAEQFFASAAAIAAPLSEPELCVGGRILAAVTATREAAGCNTNLGIILLCAPLVHAALLVEPGGCLRSALKRVLARLDVEDARDAYSAIRLAAPGGLGESDRHDVRAEPDVTLLEAMREAAERDSIARQYALGYWDVFEFGLPLLRRCLERWRSEEWATVAAYLDFLAHLPDSHIARKFGIETARALSAQARDFSTAVSGADEPARFEAALLEWDAELKQQGFNPGTSADLTVATLLAARIEELLHDEFTQLEPEPGAGGNPGGA